MIKGYKDTIMEYFNFLSTVLIILILLAFGGLLIQISANTGFVNYAEGVTSRHGGLTSSAIAEINDYSAEHYGSRYIVKGVIDPNTGLAIQDANGKAKPQPALTYGQTVEFAVEGNYGIILFQLPMKMDLRVHSVSRRR